MLYKLTKGTLSRIRTTKKECDDLIEQGYILDGEVDKDYKVINPYPFANRSEEDEKEELVELAVEAGLGAKSTLSRWSIKKLKEEIEAAE